MLSDAYLSLTLLEYVQICMTSCYKYKNVSNRYQKALIKFGISIAKKGLAHLLLQCLNGFFHLLILYSIKKFCEINLHYESFKIEKVNFTHLQTWAT